jgi:hypothetical protein
MRIALAAGLSLGERPGSTCPIMTRDVKSRTSAPYPEATALRDYVSAAGCEVLEPGTEGYALSTRIWNGALQHRPAGCSLFDRR